MYVIQLLTYQTTTMSFSKTPRIYALDSLRAIMMLLGLVIHSAITYGAFDYEAAWPLKDPQNTTAFLDMIVHFIHVFRMPLFFVISGFFAALLFFERSAHKMIKNRIYRIVFPFVIGIIVLVPMTKQAFTFSNLVIAGDQQALLHSIQYIITGQFLANISTIHLWFLYYLIMFSVCAWFIAKYQHILPSVIHKNINKIFKRIISSPLRVLLLAPLTVVSLYYMNAFSIITSTSFRPDLTVFASYGVFYFFGWMLYKNKEYLESFKRHDKLQVAIALILFIVTIMLVPQALTNYTVFIVLIILDALMVWLLIFGFTGLFLRYFNQPSLRMRYLSDASYWIYLVHLPFTAYIPGLLVPFNLSPTIKFAIVLGLTTSIALISYYLFVRSSLIGKFLNGRTYSRQLSPIKTSIDNN